MPEIKVSLTEDLCTTDTGMVEGPAEISSFWRTDDDYTKYCSLIRRNTGEPIITIGQSYGWNAGIGPCIVVASGDTVEVSPPDMKTRIIFYRREGSS